MCNDSLVFSTLSICDTLLLNTPQDHKGQKRYIVTQHPLRDTITDFWQMIWDQQITLVVMVNDEEHLQPVGIFFPHTSPLSPLPPFPCFIHLPPPEVIHQFSNGEEIKRGGRGGYKTITGAMPEGRTYSHDVMVNSSQLKLLTKIKITLAQRKKN